MLVVCPECKSEISQYSENCIKCGFPIAKFMKENNFKEDLSYLEICPVCADVNHAMPDIFPTLFYCRFCGHKMIQTDITIKKYNEDESCYIKNDILPDEHDKSIAMKYGEFDQKKFEERLKERDRYLAATSVSRRNESNQNTPKCPTCGSSNIKKISVTRKAAGAFGFGLFSKTAKSQFECKNCGYKW